MANNNTNNTTPDQPQPDPNPPKPDPPSSSSSSLPPNPNPNPNPNPSLINHPQLQPTAIPPPPQQQIQQYGTVPSSFRPPQFNPNPGFQMQPPGVGMMPGQHQYGVPGQQPPPMRMYAPPPGAMPNGGYPQVNGPPGAMNHPPVLSW